MEILPTFVVFLWGNLLSFLDDEVGKQPKWILQRTHKGKVSMILGRDVLLGR